MNSFEHSSAYFEAVFVRGDRKPWLVVFHAVKYI